MPIPSPADFRDKTKKHSEVREMMAQLAANAASQDDIDRKIQNASEKSAIYSNYISGYGLTGAAGVFGSSGLTDTATCFIIECKPNTEYEIRKSVVTDRFRIAEFSTYPTKDLQSSYFTKNEYNNSEILNSDGSVSFYFKTKAASKYLVVYTSRDIKPELLSLTLIKNIKLEVDDLESTGFIKADKFVANESIYLKNRGLNKNDEVNSFLGTGPELYIETNKGTQTETGGFSEFASIIIPVKPDTTYLMSRNQITNRFRIAEFVEFPAHHAAISNYIISNDENLESIEFKTKENTNYLVVYLVRGGVLDAKFQLTLNLKISDELVDKRIIKGKNLFNPENAYDNTNTLTVVGLEGETVNIRNIKVADNDLYAYTKTAILAVKPNTTYTIQKSSSNRFRIGFASVKPQLGTSVLVVKGESNDSNLVSTITTSENTYYLVLYLAKNGDAPAFVQVEEGSKATEKETYGYTLNPIARALSISSDGYVAAGVGDGIVDDTELLRAHIMLGTGMLSFDPNKVYKLSGSLEINTRIYKRLNGNGARFMVTNDEPAFILQGPMQSGHSASPNTNKTYARAVYGFVADHIVVYSEDWSCGIGIKVTGCLAPTIQNSNLFFLKKAIVFSGTSRDVNLIGNRIWANQEIGVELDSTCNIHQFNIVGNIITYNKFNIYVDDAAIYNLQITGNDIETATASGLDSSDGANIVILSNNNFAEDITIVGNTLEDHWVADNMVVIRATNGKVTASINIDGNSCGNSRDAEIVLEGCGGVYIGGQFKHSYGSTLKLDGNVTGLTMSVQSRKSGNKGGLISCNNPDAVLKDISIVGCQQSGGSAEKAVNIRAKEVSNFKFSDNVIRDKGTTQAPIYIEAATVEDVRVDLNQIAGNTNSKAIEIIATTVKGKNSMLFNSANTGTFNAPSQFNVQGNW